MKSDLILRIKQAEDKAQKSVEDAKSQADSLLAKARQDALSVVSKGKTDVETEAKALIQAARDAAAADAKKLASSGQKRVKKLHESFESGIEGVEKRVLGLIEGRL